MNIPIEDDQIYDHFGVISVELLPDTNAPATYTISNDPFHQSAEVMISDNETKPEISVTAVNPSVTGPNPVEFKLSTLTTSSIPIPVKYYVFVTDNSMLHIGTPSPDPEQILIPAFVTEKIIEIRDYRFSSEYYEQSGTIAVDFRPKFSLDSNSPYKITSDIANQRAEVKVLDDGSLPIISITAVADTVHEPNPAQFRIFSSKPTVQPLPVRIKVSHDKNVLEVGNYVNYSPVIIPALSTERVLDIDIENDLVSGPDGNVFVQLVIDDDAVPNYRLSRDVAGLQDIDGLEAWVTVVDDDDKPMISIADGPTVVEGSDSNAEFIITASQLPESPLAINFEISGDTRFLQSGTTLTSAELVFVSNSANESYTATLNIPIIDDQLHDNDGIIVVTLKPDTNSPVTYTIDSNPANQSAQVLVQDNDQPIPVFSIEAVTSSVEEPNPAQFRLVSPTASSQPVVVRYNRSVSGGYSDGASNDHTITVEANSIEKIFEIDIGEDQLSEPDSIITITLLDDNITPETYSITSDTAGQRAEVTVIDDDPLPEFAIEHDNFGTLEPGLAMFFLETATVSTIPVAVRINVTQTGDVISGSAGERTWTMPAMQRKFKFEIATADDEIAEPTGLVTVTLLEDNNTPVTYTVSSDEAKQSDSVEVYDDDTPISIAAGDAVVEGTDEFATFTISAAHDVRPERTVNIAVTGATNFFKPGYQIPTSVTLEGLKTSTVLQIPIEDDHVDENDGVIDVEILAATPTGDNKKEYVVGSSNRAEVQVSDDDVQTPIISITTSTESVDEGESFELVVNSTVPINYPLVVDVNLTQTSAVDKVRAEFIAGSNRQLFFSNGSTSETVSLSIIDDEVDEPNGTILASLASNNRYELGRNSAVSVAVVDNDKPVASMRSAAEENQSIPEGQLLHFGVILDRISWHPIAVNVNVSQSSSGGDFINPDDVGNSRVTIDIGERVGRFSVRTIEDDVGEESAEITATILSGDHYTVHNSASSANPNESHSASVRVIDNGESSPFVSISRVQDSIQEGDEASFLVRIDHAINEDLDIKIQINGEIDRGSIQGDLNLLFRAEQLSGVLMSNQSLESVVKIPAGEFTGSLIIPTQDDDIDEPNSKLIATLVESEQYQLSANNSTRSDTVSVLDDDVPSFTISREYVSISEKGKYRFSRFSIETGTLGVVEEVSVPVLINQSGNVIKGESRIYYARFQIGMGAYIVFVELDDDEIDEVDGRVTATLIESNDGKYNITGTGSASMVITDDDDPMISIASVVTDRAITEGEVVQFTIAARDREVDSDIRVNINVTQSSDFMTWRVPRAIVIPAGKKFTSLVIGTIDDKKEQEDGVFIAGVLAGEGYRVSSENYATVSIRDKDSSGSTPTDTDDTRVSIADKVMNSLLESIGINLEPEVVKPEISIVAANDEVAEGERIRFAIYASVAPENDLEIEISIDSPNDSIVESTPMRTTMTGGIDSHVIELQTKNDDKLESNEVITLTINEQPTYTVSEESGSDSVIITDTKDWQRHTEIARANGVVIPELAGRLSAQSLNQISERIQQGFASEGQNVLQIAGSEKLTGILEQSGDAVNNDAFLKDTLFNNSSFAFNLLPDSTGLYSATTWGSGNKLEFQSQGLGNSSMSGEMLSSHLGLDVAFNEELITGFTGTYSDTQVNYTALDSTYEYDVQMTGLFPYIGWQNTGRADYLRVVTGLGSGEIGIRQQGNSWDKFASNLYTAEVSGGLQVFADNDASDDAVSALSLDSGLRTLRYFTEQDKDVVGYFDHRQSQAHLTLEGLYAKDLSNGSELIPTAAVGLQGLSGNVANEFGYILESGIAYENPAGYTISGLGRTFFNSDDWSNDSQLQGTLAFDANYDDLGATIDVTSSWGVAPATESDSMWERHIFTKNAAAESENSQTQISTEFGYGLGILDGRGILTPYNKIDWSNTAQQTIELGSRVAVGSGISFELNGSRENRENDEVDHQINFSGSFGW